MWFVRYGIGLLVILAGVVVAAAGADLEIAGMFVGGGLGILMLNAIFRLGAEGDLERDREEEARRFLDEHGHWPDEPPPARR